MRLTISEALGLIRRSYHLLPVPDRLHIIGRFASCPFARVLTHIPSGSTILDVGAGHGLFALLAREAGAGLVVALEPDTRKVAVSHSSVRAAWVAGYDDAVRGRFDVVTMFDVLYRVPLAERDSLFARLFERVRPGGRILIKDLDASRPAKFAWNRAQEWISDNLLGLTLGDAFAYESGEAIETRLLRAGFTNFHVVEIDAWYPHSHVLYVAVRPE